MPSFKINLLKASEEYFSYQITAENYEEAFTIADAILSEPDRYNLIPESSGGTDWQLVDVNDVTT